MAGAGGKTEGAGGQQQAAKQQPPPPAASPGPAGIRQAQQRKKRYRRHAKPPYSYLAMIALVIQNSPEKRLKLSQILEEIRTRFPFFQEDYQGWKDSIRHNLSANRCFALELKDPGKPKAKGNFWTVHVERIPPEALKLQNTALSRRGQAAFSQDLAPYVLQGCSYPGGPRRDGVDQAPAPGGREEAPPPPLGSSFAMASLLSKDASPVPQAERGPALPSPPPPPPAALTSHRGPPPGSPGAGGCCPSSPGQSPPLASAPAPSSRAPLCLHPHCCWSSPRRAPLHQLPPALWGQGPSSCAPHGLAPLPLPFPPPAGLPCSSTYSPPAPVSPACWSPLAGPHSSLPLQPCPLGPTAPCSAPHSFWGPCYPVLWGDWRPHLSWEPAVMVEWQAEASAAVGLAGSAPQAAQRGLPAFFRPE
ncbi:forkhead box protein H1-like [Hemicordylus capensis]|uniref:forkhead box protein H1-like n=1 Tax=Hemicordylus capensis TaxID=884348 RepID=UPI002302C18D|nr:forkhead box protein H1-like [Hemicordylus capensis]